jgi:hypothetical protein
MKHLTSSTVQDPLDTQVDVITNGVPGNLDTIGQGR